MIELNLEQRSPEWFKARLGKITGTRLKEIFKADNLPLIDEMIAEIISEQFEDNYVNSSMQRGIDLEPIVKEYYELLKEIKIINIGFCLSEENDYLGLSPDGFTKDRKGAIEIKCPSTKNHVKYIRMNQIPNDYKHQCYCYFLVNKSLEWLDFISFDDRFKSKIMFIHRINRSEILEELEKTEAELNKFILKFEKYYKQIVE